VTADRAAADRAATDLREISGRVERIAALLVKHSSSQSARNPAVQETGE
jgi:hypothetical protein